MLLSPSPWVVLFALIIDALFGEPRNRFHPVAWLGALIEKLCRVLSVPHFGTTTARASSRPWRELARGTLLVIAAILPAVFASSGVSLLTEANPIVGGLVEIALLKSTFAVRALKEAGVRVRDALLDEDLDRARAHLSSLCSRDAGTLEAPDVVAASVESLAENASDSFVAPLLYYVLFGITGAVVYRTINTLDAMVGYRGRLEYAGKAAARLDDAANFIPARLTAVLMIASGCLCGEAYRHGLSALWHQHGRTQSPNAGWPMAAMAGLVGVTLQKRGYYELIGGSAPLVPSTIDRAWRLVRATAILTAVMAITVLSGLERAT